MSGNEFLIMFFVLTVTNILIVWFFYEGVINHIDKMFSELRCIQMMINDIQNCVDDLMERTADTDE